MERCSRRLPSESPDVFSRLGPKDSVSLSPEASPDRAVEVNWTTLVELGLELAGQRRSPSPDLSQPAEGLLASSVTHRQRTSFPPSKGIIEAMAKAFDRFSVGAEEKDCRPESLPAEASTHVPVSKVARSFNQRFHGGSTFPLATMSAKPSAEENNYLRPKAEPSVSITKLGDVETLLRKLLRTFSTLDWLLSTLREVSRLPHQDQQVLDALWANISKTLGFSSEFSSSATMALLVARRDAFLKACDPMKVPRRTHTWAALRSPFTPSRPSLLGDVGEVFRLAARDDREVAIVSSLSSSKQRSSYNAPQGTSERPRQRQGNQGNHGNQGNRLSSVVSRPQASNSYSRDSRGKSQSSRGRNFSGRKQ